MLRILIDYICKQFVALTAHNPQLFFDDFKEMKFDKLFTKPYNLQKLANLINELNLGEGSKPGMIQ